VLKNKNPYPEEIIGEYEALWKQVGDEKFIVHDL
jgi:hypothetical protein